MEKLKPYVESHIFKTILTCMYVSDRDNDVFNNDPTEHIRSLYDYSETELNVKN